MTLPRKRKVTVSSPSETPPDRFGVFAKVETKRVITGLTVEDPEGKAIRRRNDVVNVVRERYPQVTVSQLEDASIVYTDYRAVIHLNQFSPERL